MVLSCLQSTIRSRASAVLMYGVCASLLMGCFGDKHMPLLETLKLGFANPNTAIDQTPLNPNLRYLKVDANGIPALLVLGYNDANPQGQRAVWYSAFKEVVELQGGRLVSTQGLDLNWTQVSIPDAPPLSSILPNNELNSKRARSKLRYIRIRTVMPGYYVNIRETVILEALDEMPSDVPKQLRDSANNANIRWVQETVLVPPESNNPSIKPLKAVYALDRTTGAVIYGKQYLRPDYFVSWLSWPYPAKPISKAGN